jgi:hypothetical protein
MPRYDTDLTEWTKEQADALRRRAANELDWDNLAEEIESLGASERREIRSRLKTLLVHLPKWKVQPEGQCGSSRGDNPSLRTIPAESLSRACAYARGKALGETGLYRLPEACPWTIEQILEDDFLP